MQADIASLPGIYGFHLKEIEGKVKFQKSFTAKQLANWLYKHQITSYEKISNIPKSELALIKKYFKLPVLKIADKKISAKSQTQKILFETPDHHKIESVLIDNHQEGYTLCLSSQVGCSFDCTFCATGKMKFGRNLTAGEMIEQFILLNTLSGKSIKNIVYMGMGEPFAAADEVFKSIDLFTDLDGLAISPKRISISTIGLLSGIKTLAEYSQKVNLLVSLHSAKQALRDKLMPNVAKQPLVNLKKALADYQSKKRQPITLEYIMLKGINDGDEDLEALVKFSRGLQCKINLIAYNTIPWAHYEAADSGRIHEFKRRLEKKGLTVVQRYKKGDDIAAACGQLAVNVSSTAEKTV